MIPDALTIAAFCRNEVKTISAILEDAHRARLLVIDNASTDGSGDRATTDVIAQDEARTTLGEQLPTPGTREDPPLPVLARQNNRGESHQLPARSG